MDVFTPIILCCTWSNTMNNKLSIVLANSFATVFILWSLNTSRVTVELLKTDKAMGHTVVISVLYVHPIYRIFAQEIDVYYTSICTVFADFCLGDSSWCTEISVQGTSKTYQKYLSLYNCIHYICLYWSVFVIYKTVIYLLDNIWTWYRLYQHSLFLYSFPREEDRYTSQLIL